MYKGATAGNGKMREKRYKYYSVIIIPTVMLCYMLLYVMIRLVVMLMSNLMT